MNLSHLNVLVTGAGGTGVGHGICEALAGFGATLIINDIDAAKAEQAAAKYPKAIPIAADISKEEEIKRMFALIEEQVGFVNGLVNNAGVGLSREAHEVTAGEFDRLYNIDIRAVWLVSKYFVNQLLKKGEKGGIVNISSVHAFATHSKYAIYSSAKSAVEGLTRGMAYELGKHGIRVNAIGPGYVHSEQNFELISTWTDDPPQWVNDFIHHQQVSPEFIEPIDCGNTAAFLLSDLSRSITGQTIYVDRGTTIMLMNRDFTE
jgi:NAD(P)-dependent dehydrogenase (short-subunit alcohol dehydrogenase family)